MTPPTTKSRLDDIKSYRAKLTSRSLRSGGGATYGETPEVTSADIELRLASAAKDDDTKDMSQYLKPQRQSSKRFGEYYEDAVQEELSQQPLRRIVRNASNAATLSAVRATTLPSTTAVTTPSDFEPDYWTSRHFEMEVRREALRSASPLRHLRMMPIMPEPIRPFPGFHAPPSFSAPSSFYQPPPAFLSSSVTDDSSINAAQELDEARAAIHKATADMERAAANQSAAAAAERAAGMMEKELADAKAAKAAKEEVAIKMEKTALEMMEKAEKIQARQDIEHAATINPLSSIPYLPTYNPLLGHIHRPHPYIDALPVPASMQYYHIHPEFQSRIDSVTQQQAVLEERHRDLAMQQQDIDSQILAQAQASYTKNAHWNPQRTLDQCLDQQLLPGTGIRHLRAGDHSSGYPGYPAYPGHPVVHGYPTEPDGESRAKNPAEATKDGVKAANLIESTFRASSFGYDARIADSCVAHLPDADPATGKVKASTYKLPHEQGVGAKPEY